MANSISHASLPWPVKNARYTIPVPYLDADGDPLDPTTPDTEVSIDGAAYADCAEEVTTITGTNGSGFITLTGAETNCSLLMVAAKVASGPKATLLMDKPRVFPVLFSGTATAGAVGSITLPTSVPAIADLLVGCVVKTTGGTGGGGAGGANNQARIITDYTTGRVASVVPNWEVTPDATTTFEILLTELSVLSYADVLRWNAADLVAPNTAGVPRVDLDLIEGANVSTTTAQLGVNTVSLSANAITATAIAADAITAAKVADGTIDAATFAAGAINSAAIATGAIDADAIATGAIDADAIAADAVTKINSVVSGTADSGTTTTMVDAALTQADTDYWKGNFILFTSGSISGQCRLITGFNAAADTITFAPATTQAVATNTYEILPSGRVDLQLWFGSVVNALIAGRVDANAQAVGDKTGYSIGTGGITAGSFAASAIDAAALSADAVDEIWNKAMTELTAVPGVAGTVLQALEWVFLMSRNKVTQTATTQLLRNDVDGATIGTSTLSDDGTTFIRGEFA